MSSLHPTYRAPSRTAAGNLTLTHFVDVPPLSPSTIPSPLVPCHTPLATLAHTIHRSVTIPRTDGEHVRRVVALSEELYPRSTAGGRLQWWFPYVPGEGFDEGAGEGAKNVGVTVAINNLSNVDFPAIHFAEGADSSLDSAPIRSRFYTFDSWAHYVRIWKGNPVPVYDARPSVEPYTPSPTTFPAAPAPRHSRPSHQRRVVAWKPAERSLRAFFRVKLGRRDVVESIVRSDMERLARGEGLGAEVTGQGEAQSKHGWSVWRDKAKL